MAAVPSFKTPEYSVLSTFKRLENEFPVLLLLQSRQRRKEYSQKTQNHPYYYYYKAGKEGGAGVMQHGAG